MVPGLVRLRPTNVGGRAGTGIYGEAIRFGLALRDGFLFWDVLVARLRPDPLRGVSAVARLFTCPYCLPWCRDLSWSIRGRTFGSTSSTRFKSTSSCSIRMGFHGISAVLDYWKQLEWVGILPSLQSAAIAPGKSGRSFIRKLGVRLVCRIHLVHGQRGQCGEVNPFRSFLTLDNAGSFDRPYRRQHASSAKGRSQRSDRRYSTQCPDGWPHL